MKKIDRKLTGASIIAIIACFIGLIFGTEYCIILYLAGCGIGGFYMYQAESEERKRHESPFNLWLGDSCFVFAASIIPLFFIGLIMVFTKIFFT